MEQELTQSSADYYQVNEVWFSSIYQIKEYIRSTSNDENLKKCIQTTIDKGYELSDGNLYEAIYNPDIYDSVASTISIHRTREGAQKAVEMHKQQVKAAFDEIYNNPKYPAIMLVNMKYNDGCYWDIREIKIEE